MKLNNSTRPTDVYLILHESAGCPANLFYEYMIGDLRQNLQDQEYGLPLTDEAYQRARQVGRRLQGKGIAEIVTDAFVTPLETAKVIAKEIGNPRIITDTRIAESDLSYLTRGRLTELEQKSKDDPFIFTRDWYKQASQDEIERLVQGHTNIYNESIKRNDGKAFAFVLHVEGMQIYLSKFLGLPPDKMVDMHFRRGNYVHAKVFPDRDPVVSF